MPTIYEMKKNWDKFTFNEIKYSLADYDLELKYEFIKTATPETVNSVYAKLHNAWINASDGIFEYFSENNAYPEPEDEARLCDLIKLSFFYAEEFCKKTAVSNGSTPVVSVVMPLYKSFRYVWEALRSIYEQTYQDFEVVIVNEYENDDPLEKIIALFGDKRTRIIQKDAPAKLGKSLNIGIENSRGEFICRMDGDDIMLPERIEKQVLFFRENSEYDFLHTGSRTFGIDTMTLENPIAKSYEYLYAALLVGNPIIHPTVMIRKSAIIQHDLWYDENLVFEDYELWQRAVKEVKFGGLQECLFYYRVYPESTAAKFFDRGMEDIYGQQYKNRKDISRSLSGDEKDMINNMPGTIDDDGVVTRYGAHIILASRLGGLHLMPEIFPKFGYGRPEKIRRLLNNRRLVIWGAGIQSTVFREMLRGENMKYVVVDQGMEQRGETLADEPMMSINELSRGTDEYFVAIATYYRYGGIARRLDGWGYWEGRDYLYVFDED